MTPFAENFIEWFFPCENTFQLRTSPCRMILESIVTMYLSKIITLEKGSDYIQVYTKFNTRYPINHQPTKANYHSTTLR